MKNKNKIIEEGEVVELLPNLLFRVKIGQNNLILAKLSGKMRINFIKVLPGDRVLVELSPYDKTRGRIVKRL